MSPELLDRDGIPHLIMRKVSGEYTSFVSYLLELAGDPEAKATLQLDSREIITTASERRLLEGWAEWQKEFECEDENLPKFGSWESEAYGAGITFDDYTATANPNSSGETAGEAYWEDPFYAFTGQYQESHESSVTPEIPQTKGLRWTPRHRKHRARLKDLEEGTEISLDAAELSASEREREKTAQRIAKAAKVERVDGIPQWEPERDETEWRQELRDAVLQSCDKSLSDSYKQKMVAVVCKHSKMFSKHKEKLGCYLYGEVDIPTTDSIPVYSPRHKLSWAEWAVIDETTDLLVRAGVCSKSVSPWGCPTVVPPKKDATGAWTERRVCTDLRGTNSKTIRDRYPMPIPEELIANLGPARWFSTVDLILSFHQLKLTDEAAVKTAFFTSDNLLQFDRLPMGTRRTNRRCRQVSAPRQVLFK
jgi:hypothetical protein